MIQNSDRIPPALVSVVVPLFNEGPTLEALCRRMIVALSGANWEFEIIFVDDGSTDGSAETIRATCEIRRARTLCAPANELWEIGCVGCWYPDGARYGRGYYRR